MVDLSPVGDKSNEGGAVHKLQELAGGAAVGVQGDEQRGNDAALRESGAVGLEVYSIENSFICCFLTSRS